MTDDLGIAMEEIEAAVSRTDAAVREFHTRRAARLASGRSSLLPSASTIESGVEAVCAARSALSGIPGLQTWHPDADQGAPFAVYFLSSEGAIVYVGHAATLKRRVSCHRSLGRRFDAVDFVGFETKTEAETAERIAIRALVPPGNQDGVHSSPSQSRGAIAALRRRYGWRLARR